MSTKFATRFEGGPINGKTIMWPDTAQWPPTDRIIVFFTRLMGWVPVMDTEHSREVLRGFYDDNGHEENRAMDEANPPVIYRQVSRSQLQEDPAEAIKQHILMGAQYELEGPYDPSQTTQGGST